MLNVAQVVAQNDWQNPVVFQRNRINAHSPHHGYDAGQTRAASLWGMCRKGRRYHQTAPSNHEGPSKGIYQTQGRNRRR